MPVAVGLNTSDTVQLAPAARVVPQVFADCTNEVGFAPVNVTPAVSKVTVEELVFCTVITCAPDEEPTETSPHTSLVGLNVSGGEPPPPVPPVPDRDAVCGEPVALSATESDAVSDPVRVGLNSTETVQLAPAARLEPQVVDDSRNELALVPVMLMPLRVTAEVPVSCTVTVCAAVVEPTAVEANVRLVGESVMVSAPPVPVPATDIVCSLPLAP